MRGANTISETKHETRPNRIYDLANLIHNAVDAGLYRSAQEKLDLLAHEIADLSEALNWLRLIEQRIVLT